MLPKRTNDSLQDKGWDLDNAFLAQLAEQDFCKVQVVGSIPTEGSFLGALQGWRSGLDCKSSVL